MPTSYRQDQDVKEMSPAQLRREVMKLRRKIRWHRDREENERCWHCDRQLYAALPEEKPAGNMRGDPALLLRNCLSYICRQKCVLFGCNGRLSVRRRLGQLITATIEQFTQHSKT